MRLINVVTVNKPKVLRGLDQKVGSIVWHTVTHRGDMLQTAGWGWWIPWANSIPDLLCAVQSHLARGRREQHNAEACFQQALDVSRQQQAKSFELRAAMSLARLWQRQGKRQEAYDLLAPIYGWFTEGFDTADLKDAKILLQELA